MHNPVKKNSTLLTILSSIFSLLNLDKSIKKIKGIKLRKKDISKNEQIHNNNLKQLSVKCPKCQHTITLKNEISESIPVQCPTCGTIGVIHPLQKKQNTLNLTPSITIITDTKLITTRKKTFNTILGIKILGLLTIIIGITIQFSSNLFSLKTNVTFIIIGAIILAFFPSNRESLIESKKIDHRQTDGYNAISQNDPFIKQIYNSITKQFDISEIITIAIILWITLFYVITGNNRVDTEIFIISIYLGLLGIKVITHKSLHSPFKQRMNVFILAFLLIFIIIVILRILSLA